MQNKWIFLNPDDLTFGPARNVPVWITDGRCIAMALRVLESSVHLRSQYIAIRGFELPEYPTHFAYAAPPLPTTEAL